MKKTVLFLSAIALLGFFSSNIANATNKTESKVRFLTLSNGNYKEFYNNDSIVQIGTALLNTYTNKIVGFVADDTTELVSSSDNSSRWLSVDPLAEKYHEVSPYVYCNNNPMIYIDPDGREWTISYEKDKNGHVTYTINVTAAVMNSSSNSKLDMTAFANSVKGQIESAWNFESDDISVKTNVSVSVVNDKSDLEGNEHVFNVVDKVDDQNHAALGDFKGLQVDVGKDYVGDIISGKNTRSIPHELGHTGGLNHPQDKNADWTYEKSISKEEQNHNLMSQSWFVQNANNTNSLTVGRDLTNGQMKQVFYNYAHGALNKHFKHKKQK